MKQTKTIAFFQYQLPLLAWCVFIYTVSSIPQTRIPNLLNYTDKIVHAGVFFILCWLAHVALHFQPVHWLRKQSLTIAMVFVILFGVSDEYHQMFTPGRTTEIWDLVADAVGGGFYVSLYMYFKFYDSLEHDI